MTHGFTAALTLAVLVLQTIKSSRHGKQNIGADNPRALLTDEDVRIIRGSSESIRTLAKRFDVSRSTIHKIKQRLTWRHI